MKEKILRVLTVFLLTGWVKKNYGKQDLSSDLVRPLTCKDILFVALPLVPDKDGERMRELCYTLCMHNTILKNKLDSVVQDEERRMLKESIATTEKLIKVAILAFRAHYFVFGPMKFRQFLSEKQLSGAKDMEN